MYVSSMNKNTACDKSLRVVWLNFQLVCKVSLVLGLFTLQFIISNVNINGSLTVLSLSFGAACSWVLLVQWILNWMKKYHGK